MTLMSYRLPRRGHPWPVILLALTMMLCASLTEAALQSIGFTPANPTLKIGQSAQFTATGYFSDGTQQVLAQAKQVSAGGNHTCALAFDGTIKCWGDNARGQLGNGTITSTKNPVPVAVVGINNAVVVDAGNGIGGAHSCALLADGAVRCWGLNSYGQLGNGTTTSSPTSVTVSDLSNVVSISVGSTHTCAVLANSAIKCWGNNINGQLGDGTTTNALVPVIVSDINNAVSVSAGNGHTCAVLADTTVRCWGRNDYGQLGNGTLTSSLTPITVSGLSAVKTVRAGYGHACAVLADTTVRCWGNNSFGQLGNGTTIDSLSPVIVSGLSTAVAVSVGTSHSCATLANQTLRCWGNNYYGQLGNSTGTNSSALFPVTVSGISTAVGVSTGNGHSCATLADGTLRCWGNNIFGQLGVVMFPVPVSGIRSAVAVSSGAGHVCMLLADGTVRCRGGNNLGQLGNGTTTDTDTLATVAVSGISNAVAISAGYGHTCALLADGTLRCWGKNDYGELGNGIMTTSPTPIPVIVTGISNAVAVDAGTYHTCAVLSDGTIKCWGLGSLLGNGNTNNSATPTTVSGIRNAVAVSAGANHSCAVLADGKIQCWGYGAALGNGMTTGTYVLKPVTVSGISSAVAVDTGDTYSCAVLSDRTLRCWGNNQSGQLGNGTTTFSSIPVSVSGISTAVGISVANIPFGEYTCATLVDGTVRCWGNNFYGQLGNGFTNSSLTPVIVSGLSTAVEVSAGFTLMCVLLTDGTVQCWGEHYKLNTSYSFNPVTTLGYHPLTWTSANPTVASTNSTGAVQAKATGSSLISASLEGISASTVLTVTPAVSIDGFWPGTTDVGKFVFIFGNGFVSNKTQVMVNGIPATFVQVADPTLLYILLPTPKAQSK